MIQINLDVQFHNKKYKGFLSKLKTFLRYCCTVGIHDAQGKQLVLRKYKVGVNKKGKDMMKTAGASHRMTVAKVAYQNEYGTVGYGGKFPNIKIPIKYKYTSKKLFKQYADTFTQRLSIYQRYRFVSDKRAKKQGYIIKDLEGETVRYYNPGHEIAIPPRPFVRKTIENNQALYDNILRQVGAMFTDSGRAYNCWKQIGKMAEYYMKLNVRKQPVLNDEITARAKGHRSPLTDSNDRIYKAIKYKLYRDVRVKGSEGQIQYDKGSQRVIDTFIKGSDRLFRGKKLNWVGKSKVDLKSVETFNNIPFNPNFMSEE